MKEKDKRQLDCPFRRLAMCKKEKCAWWREYSPDYYDGDIKGNCAIHDIPSAIEEGKK